MYPLLFKMGYQRGKVWGYYVPAVLICLIYVAMLEYDAMAGNGFLLNLLVYASDHLLVVSGGMFAAGGMLLAFSCLLSLWLYGRREF
jgi:hypothetical protein